MKHQMLAACGAVALGTSLAAFAQPAVNAPITQMPATLQPRYTSAFADYKPWRELTASDWRQANDGVRPAAAKSGAAAADAAMDMSVHMPMPAATPASAASSAAATMPPMHHGGHAEHAGHGGKP